ncbi:mitochondrial distribution and morphology protein 34 [Talaromyces proteolyticus]|uniref:Mitochondrial distribution and morphology protein 34 n=1 Tax=Talaromyces proteolyticus TaxID=1131652 RepID=A0AAD4Q5G7_9EURO|nr:mitochondrial distribution and morphology protein 34 [Talaromyces proteolyticus]KAH8704166.1 mitochondrial distribution and morphology protein 34 [Talaromyces proteolyticus]
MAFNFNWSPLMADAGFYTRAQDLLTAALNKSPKPPIIVDDIKVTELNLGSIPPDLEILEVGDLAEDRFRGIFKMSYVGDAFLTLKTRVQANPMNTLLMTRPSFASPKPLAAAAGLTIPLQITLSEFRLSGFVVLVFSKQKGITVVFRNDPLESLKVSSTFDSIPFVRDYLQKAIEGQLRILFMDELPAIIHRLSLRLWVPEYRDKEEAPANTLENPAEPGPGQDPLASPPQDPVDALGNALNPSEIASLSLDSGVEIHSLFSQKNLLRLAALTDSQRTLSLFTPSIRDVVYRAWTASSDLGESNTLTSPMSPALSRTQSHIGSLHSFVDNASTVSLQSGGSSNFSSYGLHLRSGRHSKSQTKKRKKRVVDLRRPKTTDDVESVSGDSSSCFETTTSAPTVFSSPAHFSEEKNDDPVTPPLSPQSDLHLPTVYERQRMGQGERTLTQRSRPLASAPETGETSSSMDLHPFVDAFPDPDATPRNTVRLPSNAGRTNNKSPERRLPSSAIQYTEIPPRGIIEQAWVNKMAGELARRMHDEKIGSLKPDQFPDYWENHGREELPPPAYGH